MTPEFRNFFESRGIRIPDSLDEYLPESNKTFIRQFLASLRNATFFDNLGNYDEPDLRNQFTSTLDQDPDSSFDDFSGLGESVRSVQTATIVSFTALVIVAIIGYIVSRHCCLFGNKPPDVESNQPRVPQFNFLGYGAPVMRRLSTRIRATANIMRPGDDLPPAYDDLFPVSQGSAPPPSTVPTVSFIVENQAPSTEDLPPYTNNHVIEANNSSSEIVLTKPETSV